MPTTWPSWLGLHEIILYVVIALLISALGGGPLLKAMFRRLMEFFGHGTSETIVNIGTLGGEMVEKLPKECSSCGFLIDPTKCPMHAAEHERSMRNEEEYKKLWENYGKLRDEMGAGFKEVQKCINESQKTILGALAGTRIGYEKPGRGGG